MYARDEWSDAEEQRAWRPTVQLTDEQFDELQPTPDEPDPAPNLERAARRRKDRRG